MSLALKRGAGGGQTELCKLLIRLLAAAAGSPWVLVSWAPVRDACLQDSIASRSSSKRDGVTHRGASRWLFNPVQYVVIQNGAMTAVSSSLVVFFLFFFFQFFASARVQPVSPSRVRTRVRRSFSEAAGRPFLSPPSSDFSVRRGFLCFFLHETPQKSKYYFTWTVKWTTLEISKQIQKLQRTDPWVSDCKQ